MNYYLIRLSIIIYSKLCTYIASCFTRSVYNYVLETLFDVIFINISTWLLKKLGKDIALSYKRDEVENNGILPSYNSILVLTCYKL